MSGPPTPKAGGAGAVSVPTNAEAAALFREVADLLDILGEKFKPEAYRRAARSIESLTEDLGKVAGRHELRSIPGVGDAIEEKIRELLETGHIAYRDRLVREVPPGLLEIVRLPGLGPKTARRFWVDLGVEGPAELRAAIEAGRLDAMKGFGPKKIDQIRSALAASATSGVPDRRPIEAVYPVAIRLLHALRDGAPVDQAEIAGSFRRGRETVGDLDLLVTSGAPERVFDVFSGLAEVREIRLRGGTKETVILDGGLQVDLRVVEPEAFGAALQYFTGSKDHNVRLRTLARDRGLKINEYGVFRGEERLAGRTEEDVYASLGLAWIPPELREDQGEIDDASKGALPRLVGPKDLGSDLHLHLDAASSPADVERLLSDARARRYASIAVVVAGVASDGSTFRIPADLHASIERGARGGPRIDRVVEVGPGPIPATLEGERPDFWILRPTGKGAEAAAALPKVDVRLVAHVGSGDGDPGDRLRPWLEVARSRGAAVEIGPGPERLDSRGARLARSLGVPLALPTGLGGGPEDPTLPIALAFARRAGATVNEVANAGGVPPKGGRGARPRRPG